MTTIDENLKTFLQADSNITRKVGTRVYENFVPKSLIAPFIFFVQTGDDDELCLDDSPGSGPFRYRFSVECVGQSLRDSRTLATLVRSRLNKLASGTTFGDSTVQGCFAENQSDSYEARTEFTGFHVAALDVEVIP